ncbi:MAG: hypothetical protein M1472_00925 [Planctomycetes bacterium]|jgi:hypothetical protein|nr:hypothetical protein [Planctomycetota bacterium]
MSKEWDRNNFPMGITIEYSTTGQAGGHITDSAPESTHQPVQQLFGSYCASVPYQNIQTDDDSKTFTKIYGRSQRLLQKLYNIS